MKKYTFPLTALFFGICLCSCGNNSGSSSTTDSTSNTNTTMSSPDSGKNNTSTNTETNNQPTPTSTSNTPLAKEDSVFVMKAAMGGMEEVEGGNIAQQNGMNQRVKDFGSMMVRDHPKANDELKSLASTKGLTLPSALPADKMKHLDGMRKMKGKDFDSHYISMMVNDHKTDIGEFEKASKNAKDPDLKAWATKTLPTLKTHLDSAQAINKAH
jgi:putative membrane protein